MRLSAPRRPPGAPSTGHVGPSAYPGRMSATKKILLPDTTPLDPRLPAGWVGVSVDARAEIPAEHHDAQGLVIWGASRRHLASAARDLPELRFVQSLAAGVEGILAAGLREDIAIGTGAGLHSRTVPEHTLAMLLALLRRIPQSLDAQAEHRWAHEIGGIQPLRPEGRLTSLLGTRVLIWGFGDIGQHLAPLLRALGAEVRGVARSAGTRAGVEVIAADEVREALPQTDILISILPGGPATERVIGAEVLAALPEHAMLVNVGRGTVVDQTALREALEAGTIGAAAIDVTEPEPLPAEDPLWEAPNLLITPHAAGGRPVGADERIEENLMRFEAGEELLHPAR